MMTYLHSTFLFFYGRTNSKILKLLPICKIYKTVSSAYNIQLMIIIWWGCIKASENIQGKYTTAYPKLFYSIININFQNLKTLMDDLSNGKFIVYMCDYFDDAKVFLSISTSLIFKTFIEQGLKINVLGMDTIIKSFNLMFYDVHFAPHRFAVPDTRTFIFTITFYDLNADAIQSFWMEWILNLIVCGLLSGWNNVTNYDIQCEAYFVWNLI